MLWTIIVILVVLWLLGFIGHVGGGLIHLLLVIAVVVLIINLIQGRRRLCANPFSPRQYQQCILTIGFAPRRRDRSRPFPSLA